jgi:hypothetical protein
MFKLMHPPIQNIPSFRWATSFSGGLGRETFAWAGKSVLDVETGAMLGYIVFC